MSLRDGVAELDAATAGGQWLFRQGEVLLGPVTGSRLVELLNRGEVDGSTAVAPVGAAPPQFRPLCELEGFRVALAKAQVRLKVEAQHAAQRRRERRHQAGRLAVAALAVAALELGGALLAIHQPWKARVAPEPVIIEELPTVRLASRRGGAEDELEYPRLAPGKDPSVAAVPRGARPGRAGAGAPGNAPAGAGAAPGSAGGEADDVRSVQQWDAEAINAVVRTNKATLHGCLVAETHRRGGGWQAAVPIEFTVGNDGRVTRLWIDHPEFKAEECELYQCMLAELRKWHFPAYRGEQANVSLSFRVQGR